MHYHLKIFHLHEDNIGNCSQTYENTLTLLRNIGQEIPLTKSAFQVNSIHTDTE